MRLYTAPFYLSLSPSLPVSLRARAPGCSVGVELNLAYRLATVLKILISERVGGMRK